jgi:hypothetical protein
MIPGYTGTEPTPGEVGSPKPYKFIGFGDVHGPKPYKFIGFGDLHGPKPYEIIGFGDVPQITISLPIASSSGDGPR